MKRISFILLVFVCSLVFCNQTFAQKTDTKGSNNEFVHKLFTGGTLGLQFGNYTYINIAPFIGYRFNDYLACGLGPNYIFYRFKVYTDVYKTNLYGGNVFTRVYFLKDVIPSIKDIYLHGEFEALNIESQYFDLSYMHTEKRYWVGSVFGGAGIRQILGDRAFATITVLYNFNETIDSPYYGNPLVYRIGLEINL